MELNFLETKDWAKGIGLGSRVNIFLRPSNSLAEQTGRTEIIPSNLGECDVQGS